MLNYYRLVGGKMNSFLEVKNSIFYTFYMVFCGIEKCISLHSFGPAVRNCYLLHFCLDGKGKYYVREREYHIGKGEGFLIYPNEVTFYQADEEEPWTYIWVAFSGARAEEYLKLCGIDFENLVFKSDKGDELKKCVEIMLQQKEIGIKNEFFIQGLLFQFISLLILENNEVKKKLFGNIKQRVQYR